jgi:hypothetical protein
VEHRDILANLVTQVNQAILELLATLVFLVTQVKVEQQALLAQQEQVVLLEQAALQVHLVIVENLDLVEFREKALVL